MQNLQFMSSKVEKMQSSGPHVKSIYGFKLKQKFTDFSNFSSISLRLRFLCSIDQAIYVDAIKLLSESKNGKVYVETFCPSDLNNNKCHCRGYKWFTLNCHSNFTSTSRPNNRVNNESTE